MSKLPRKIFCVGMYLQYFCIISPLWLHTRLYVQTKELGRLKTYSLEPEMNKNGCLVCKILIVFRFLFISHRFEAEIFQKKTKKREKSSKKKIILQTKPLTLAPAKESRNGGSLLCSVLNKAGTWSFVSRKPVNVLWVNSVGCVKWKMFCGANMTLLFLYNIKH